MQTTAIAASPGHPLCECGCGQAVGVARQTLPEYGHVKGEAFRFRGGHQRRLIPAKGYPAKRRPDGRPGVQEIHQLKAEQAYGGPLPRTAQVHHVDGTKSTRSQLVICQDAAYHKFLHIRTRVLRAGGDPNTERLCLTCRAIKPIDAFVKDSSHYCMVRSMCQACATSKARARRESGR
jgi:hypothetical protein